MGADPKVVAAIKEHFGDLYGQAHWPDASQAAAVEREREALVAALLAAGASETARGSKLHSGPLSRGCQACIAGTWSCLYVAKRCQAECFYCPRDAEYRISGEGHVPRAERIEFVGPELYADYVAAFGVESVGLSGGEPLMVLDQVLRTVAAIKERTAGRTHVYVYTNGKLATHERLTSLRDAGVDEIRFDISAFGYDTAALARARSLIDTITVEIPAIPEDEERLLDVIHELESIGVDHLNLHQLEVTRDNAPAFMERGYTFVHRCALHQTTVAILESEMTGLRVFRRALEEGVKLPINYCCPAYQQRFQYRRTLRRGALLARRAHEDISESGHLRELTLLDRPDHVAQIAQRLAEHSRDGECAAVSGDGGALALNLAALRAAEPGDAALKVTYFAVDLASTDQGDDWHKVWSADSGSLWARRRVAAATTLTQPLIRDAYVQLLAEGWDEARVFANIQAAGGGSADALRAHLREWSQVRQLGDSEVMPSGLGPIE